MNIPLLIANILCVLAFFLHTFAGDLEMQMIEPDPSQDPDHKKQEKWTQARCGWHWISFDLMFASIGLGLIVFTDFFEAETLLLKILSIYFLGYGMVWLIGITISKSFPMNYLKLGQWILLWLISGLTYWGIS